MTINRAYMCAATLAHADEFIDGELAPQEAAGVEDHLLACASCRQAFQRELNLKNLVRQACACDAVPDHVRVRVLARITELRLEPGIATFESLTIHADWTPDR